jgi:uncharacterized hydrophobic protein (TIGR00271 family)
MLHLRVYCPAELTDRAVEVLTTDSTVTEMVQFRGVGMAHAPDLIEAEIVREAANEVIEALHALGIAEQGAIQLDPVDTWISRRGYNAEQGAPGSSPDAVVWAEVTHKAYADSELTWTYVTFMTMATLIAAIGIVLDSQILTIGAMVLGPEFGAVAALGLALVRRRYGLLRQAVRTLALGFVIAIGIVTVASLLARAVGAVELSDVVGPRPLTEFIYHPDLWSLLVSVFAGAAGVLALTSARVGGLSGVFISVTTVPASGNVALGLAWGAWDEVVGSSLQLVINISGMALSGWLTLVIQQSVWTRISDGYRHRRRSTA